MKRQNAGGQNDKRKELNDEKEESLQQLIRRIFSFMSEWESATSLSHSSLSSKMTARDADTPRHM